MLCLGWQPIMSDDVLTRREAVARVRALIVGPATPPRLAPREQLVNVLEYEEQAKAALAADVYALIAGGDRSADSRRRWCCRCSSS